jgi:hypothetical protein
MEPPTQVCVSCQIAYTMRWITCCTLADSRLLEQKRFEVARLRSDIEDKQVEIERAQQGLNRVALQFTILNGKLGQFEGIWNKLIEDVKALHEYLENPNPWLTAKVSDGGLRITGILTISMIGLWEACLQGRSSVPEHQRCFGDVRDQSATQPLGTSSSYCTSLLGGCNLDSCCDGRCNITGVWRYYLIFRQ